MQNIEKVINSVFDINDYNFNQLSEIRSKAKEIIEPLLAFPALKDHVTKYINAFYIDDEAIEKGLDIVKKIAKNIQMEIIIEDIEQVKMKIIELKKEYKAQKIIY
ncbi:hypothetical protein [Acinetobacter celticus]|uniref:Uncharacterized protein n=1 Tax=Acinetobacter celticus TaxID=1891224 RepID=A0A1C3CYQ7_9GAMM|nr:hypothetical protein [Acinetobacter celticus]ODA13883.1 hypothetical protein BBP83_14845 [Acinetobacter celticus]